MSNITGKFNIIIHSPVGKREATLTLSVTGGILTGELSTDKHTAPLEGSATETTFEFKTKVPTPMGQMKAVITGTIEGDELTGNAKLPLGQSKITGQREV